MTTRAARQLENAEPEISPGEHHRHVLDVLERDPETGARLLFQAFSHDVNRLVWRVLGADPEHNDVVQQVFFKVLSQRHTLREPEKLRAWVHSIAVNTIYQELRRREVRRWLKLSWRPPKVHGDLVQEMEARDFLVVALRIIDRLPPAERLVFSLRYVEDRTLPEISELCGFSIGTTKRRLNAALTRFHRLVAAHPELAHWLEQQGKGSLR